MNLDRRVGWRRSGLLPTLAMKILTTFYRRMLVVALSIEEWSAAPEPPAGFAVRLLGLDDLRAYLRLRPDQGESVIRARLALGDRCFGVWRGPDLLHTGWVATRSACPVPYLEHEIRLLPGDVHPYDHHTRADARRLGIARLRMDAVFEACRSEGYRRSVGVVAWENATAIAAARAASYHVLGLVSRARFGRWRRLRVERWSDEPMPAFVAAGRE